MEGIPMKQRTYSKKDRPTSQADGESPVELPPINPIEMLRIETEKWTERAIPICEDAERHIVGRPSKFLPEVIGKFLAAIAMGNKVRNASRLANISEDAISEWLSRGESGEPGYCGFVGLHKDATSYHEHSLVTHIVADPSWTSKAWKLERTNPADWSRSVTLDVNHSGEVIHTHRLDATPILSTTEYAGVLDQTLRALAPPPIDTTYRSMDVEPAAIHDDE
jgi:hypothetical protein